MKTKDTTKNLKTSTKKKIYIPPAIIENDVTIADAAESAPAPAPLAPKGPIAAPSSPAPAPLAPVTYA